jgi:hypothetical protein
MVTVYCVYTTYKILLTSFPPLPCLIFTANSRRRYFLDPNCRGRNGLREWIPSGLRGTEFSEIVASFILVTLSLFLQPGDVWLVKYHAFTASLHIQVWKVLLIHSGSQRKLSLRQHDSCRIPRNNVFKTSYLVQHLPHRYPVPGCCDYLRWVTTVWVPGFPCVPHKTQ